MTKSTSPSRIGPAIGYILVVGSLLTGNIILVIFSFILVTAIGIAMEKGGTT